jgi:hypothetical protein
MFQKPTLADLRQAAQKLVNDDLGRPRGPPVTKADRVTLGRYMVGH